MSPILLPAPTESARRLAAQDAPARERVVILGFDGADPALLRRWMDAGELPHLAALAHGGTFAPLATTNPAESPVAWAAFSIGANPGRTGIFDFLRRVPDTYVPDIALVERGRQEVLPEPWMRVGASLAVGLTLSLVVLVALLLVRRLAGRRARPTRADGIGAMVCALLAATAVFAVLQAWVPTHLPRATNGRRGTPFWDAAAEHDVACCVLQVPVTFPAAAAPGNELLSGLGTPDVRGTWGTFAIYAEDFPETFVDPVNALGRDLYIDGMTDSVTGGKVVHVEFPGGVRTSAETVLFGPRNFALTDQARRRTPPPPEELRPALHIDLDRAAGTATFRSGGLEVSAAAGSWTDWLELTFELNPLVSIRGLVRFRVRSVAPEFYAYASPINFHPAHPPWLAPLSAPRGYSAELVRRTGHLHETVGWAIATNPLKDELIDEDEFLEDARFSFESRWRLIRTELERDDWRLFVGVTLATDRIQHMFWRYQDPDHPLHDPAAPERHRNAIRDAYRRMDDAVGETVARFADGRTSIWIISDHGFASFRRGVHLNSWLVEEGLMTLIDPTVRERGRLADIAAARSPFANVDWSRTAAYSLGLGKIYLNRRGREPEGIIETPQEADEVMNRIISGLESYRDPDTGGRVVRTVYRSRDLFHGPYAHEAADLVVGFESGYRVSWDTAAGRAPEGVVEDNRNKWSGDHCSVDPTLVPGIVVTNERIAVDDPSIIDVARTVMTTLGAAIPPELEGRDLLGR